MAKKTKKIETPIDQRETFVSIQKSFADSDISVEEKLKTLYRLQEADSAIDKILQLRGELPLEVETLENEIEQLQVKEAAITAAIADLTKSINDYNLNIQESSALLEKYQGQVNNITNSREFDSLNKEIENQDLLIQIAQKRIGEAKEAIAAKRMELEVAKDQLTIKNDDLEAKKIDLAGIVESTSQEEAVLREKRAVCASKIDARTMSAYERIRSSVHNHLAVVPVMNGDSCGGCMCQIPPQRRIDIASNKKLIICDYCGRILVNPDFGE